MELFLALLWFAGLIAFWCWVCDRFAAWYYRADWEYYRRERERYEREAAARDSAREGSPPSAGGQGP